MYFMVLEAYVNASKKSSQARRQLSGLSLSPARLILVHNGLRRILGEKDGRWI
jgi:hypothetical protein